MRRLFALACVFSFGCGEIVIGDALDGGEPELPDAGRRAAPRPQADAGMTMPECTTPDLPATWPFVQSKAVYVTEFFGALATAGCEVCHVSLYPPYMPPNAAALDDPAKLTAALGIWERALPATRASGDSTPGLLWRHDQTKGATAPYYSAQVLTHLETFVARGSDCLWAPVTAEGSADPMLCEPPAVDLSYCR